MTLGVSLSWEAAVLGGFNGLTYALLGIGLVLIYRATRVINFAHGEIGAFGAALFAKMVLDWGWPWVPAFVTVVLAGAAIGAAVELTVIRRLFDAPRVILLVATIGIAQLFLLFQLLLPEMDNVRTFPSAFDVTWRVSDTLVIRASHITVTVIAPFVVLALVLLLNRTIFGVAIRAAAENAMAARLASINVKRVSTAVWVLAGALAVATFVLVAPLQGFVPGTGGEALGPGLLLRALAAALVGRLVSLPLTVAGGLGVGVVEAFLSVNVSTGAVDLWMFVAVFALVWTRARDVDDEDASWSLAPKVREVPARLREIGWVRRLPQLTFAVALGVAAVLPLVFTTSARQFALSRVLVFAIIGLSVVVVTGWAGQLSLAQFAFAGLGAAAVLGLTDNGMPFAPAVVYATVLGVVAALLVGAPALRIRGLFLAVTTLAFAVGASGYLIPHDTFFAGQAFGFIPRGEWWIVDLASERTYYWVCLAVLAVTVVALSRLRRSGVGRVIVAVRENERCASSFTVSPSGAKLTAFSLSGGIAALGGALLAGLNVQLSPTDFGVNESLDIVALAIIGGLGSPAGAVLGAAYLLGLPAIFDGSPEVALLTSSIGLLLLVLYMPGGLLQLAYRVRDALLSWVDRRAAVTTDEATSAADPVRPRPTSPISIRSDHPAAVEGAPPLRTVGATVRFGGLTAVDDVSIDARPGEVVGLIGSNGAGKSTLMDAVGGYVPLSDGRIELFGHDVTTAAPHERASLGIGRVFQDARLFGDLSVTETVAVALEAREKSELVPSLIAASPARRAERARLREASELIDFVGLGRYADHFIADLSTGTRRIAELACLLAVQARLMLLDEPTAGVAQRETEAFGPLLLRLRRELDATMVIIEHDMPLVMSMSDRIYCLSSGQVIAHGSSQEVRDDPAVIAAYLGTDERAIQRSDSGATTTSSEQSTTGPAVPVRRPGRSRPLVASKVGK